MKQAADLPVDQHMLCALAAGKDRHMIVVTGIISEGWNNTEGQCLAWIASQPVWDLLGAGEQNNMIIHLDGHAILPSDMEKILELLKEYGGVLPFTEKADPEVIRRETGMSKKEFKLAVGHLYKERRIQINDGKIRLVKE